MVCCVGCFYLFFLLPEVSLLCYGFAGVFIIGLINIIIIIAIPRNSYSLVYLGLEYRGYIRNWLFHGLELVVLGL